MRLRIRLILSLVTIVGVTVIFVVALQQSRSRVVAALGGFSASGVQVDLTLEHRSDAPCVLAARYTPLRERFHVYSKDLPPDGVNGLGRPTRLDIVSGLVATGELSADATTSDLKTEGLDEVLPVYPDGPVTLRLPVRVTGNGNAQVKLSYMACSAFTCLPPTARTLEINLSNCEMS